MSVFANADQAPPETAGQAVVRMGFTTKDLTRVRKLVTARWADFERAYDSMPHDNDLNCAMGAFRIARRVRDGVDGGLAEWSFSVRDLQRHWHDLFVTAVRQNGAVALSTKEEDAAARPYALGGDAAGMDLSVPDNVVLAMFKAVGYAVDSVMSKRDFDRSAIVEEEEEEEEEDE